MSLWKNVVLAGVAAIGILAWSGVGFAQEAGAGAGGGGRGARGGRGGDPAQIRERMLERTKEALGMTDEDWIAVKPSVEKISVIQAELTIGRGGFGGRTAEPQGEPSPLRKATDDLRGILSDVNDGMPVTPDQIKERLTAYREAREKARQDLAAAQEELRGLLTVQQEAVLVIRGILD